MLSTRQKEVLDFIKRYRQKHHCSPSQREIQAALGISSFSFLNRTLDRLEASGHIERNNERARHNIDLCQSPYSLPLLGRIAAGSPIEAIAQPDEVVITETLLGENRYLLQVKGDSMIDDYICDGDLVICERCDKAISGTIVVALISRGEATLKRIFYEKGQIRLEPSNKNYQPQYYKPDEVIVQGKFVGLIRLDK